jgi:hypothetical protein
MHFILPDAFLVTLDIYWNFKDKKGLCHKNSGQQKIYHVQTKSMLTKTLNMNC